jgi:hypothetical protein
MLLVLDAMVKLFEANMSGWCFGEFIYPILPFTRSKVGIWKVLKALQL